MMELHKSMTLKEANKHIVSKEIARIRQEHQEILRLHEQQEKLLQCLVETISQKQR